MPKYDILTIGNAIVDILIPVDEVELKRLGISKGTTTLIDADMAHDLMDQFVDARKMSGGSAANTAAMAARYGAKTAFIGKVHADELGRVFRQDMRRIGVDFDTAPDHYGARTARCFVFITPDAERSMCTYLGACVELGAEDIDRTRVRESGITLIEGYLWDDPRAKAAIRVAVQEAKSAGQKVALTLSDPFCVKRHRAEFFELIRDSVDVLFANEAEIKALFETDDFEEALKRTAPIVDMAAVTRGSKGSVILKGGQKVAVAAQKVSKVVDTTGAGDAFAAGFLAGLSRGKTPKNCAREGHKRAAEVIQHFGARPDEAPEDKETPKSKPPQP